MALVSGSNWAERIQVEEETGNPYEEEYPRTKWDSAPITSSIDHCPKCDCTQTAQGMKAVISSLQKFSDYQEAALGEIISILQARIAAEGGGEAKATRSSIVGGVASIYGTEKALADFWAGLQQVQSLFNTRSPQASDVAMLQSQLANIEKFSALYSLEPAKVSDWKSRINKWISMALTANKKSIYFASNTTGFGQGGS
jgi:hypothetical protein